MSEETARSESVRDDDLMRCGCRVAAVQERGHEVPCPVALIVAEYDGKLARAVDRMPVELAAMSTETADWTSAEVIREGAILRLDSQSLEGVWQRQDGQLVPLVENGLAELIDTCHYRGCGICARCDEERHYFEVRLQGLKVVDRKLEAAVAAAEQARREYELWTACCVGDDFDLGGRDAADCLSDLQAAGQRLRGALRIIRQHAVSMQNECER